MIDENIQDVDLENNEDTTTVDTTVDTGEESDELLELRAFKLEADKKAAIARRLAKKPQNSNNNNSNDQELAKDIAEFKFDRKVSRFAEDNGLTRAQAEKVLQLNPNATADDLKDEFMKAGLEALAKKQRVNVNTPRGRNTTSNTPAKSLTEMTPAEKQAWYASN